MVILSTTRSIVVAWIADIAISAKATGVVVIFGSARAVVIAASHS
jgi:hypothetical protein